VPLDRIVATALRILDDEGPDALTLRALAHRLESSTATLYRHFDSRADLLAQVVDRILGEIDLDGDELASSGWQEACRTMATTMFDVLRRHRNAAPLLAEHLPTGRNAMLHRERSLALLLEAGFAPPLAARAYATIARHVLGFAMQLRRDSAAEQRDDERVSEFVHRLDPDRFPATLAVAESLPVALEEEFAFGLQLILAGLAELHERDAIT
jgi:AcrR family transcriptional regulator